MPLSIDQHKQALEDLAAMYAAVPFNQRAKLTQAYTRLGGIIMAAAADPEKGEPPPPPVVPKGPATAKK